MPKVKIVCQKCSKEFEDYLSNHKKYCSRKCASHTMFQKGQEPWIKGKHHSEESKLKNSISRTGKMTGEDHPLFKGRVVGGHGYIMIYSPDHPNKSKDNYVGEHRLIMEQYLGRYLDKKEHVHHKNKIVSDNRIENLELMSESDHHKLHTPKQDKKGRFICNK